MIYNFFFLFLGELEAHEKSTGRYKQGAFFKKPF